MRAKLFLIGLLMTSWMSPFAHAESTDCGSPAVIIPDGRLSLSTFPQMTTFWYALFTQAGHSYSVEFEPPSDNYIGTTKVQFATIAVFGPDDYLAGCRGVSSVDVTQNSAYAPTISKGGNGVGRRISFVAQRSGLYLISATNVSNAGSYSFRAVDTTLVNMRWSTSNGFGAQWGFLNRSDMPVTGTFTIYDTGGYPIIAVKFVVPAGGKVFRRSYSDDLNLPSGARGYTVFSHNGAPGAILADAALINPTGIVETYSMFERAYGL
jgi:hypothetical protein